MTVNVKNDGDDLLIQIFGGVSPEQAVDLPWYRLADAERTAAEIDARLLVGKPLTPEEVYARFNGTEVVADLTPTPMTHEEIYARFNRTGKYAVAVKGE